MSRKRKLTSRDREVSDFDRGKRTPPRPQAFSYALNGQRYILHAPEHVVLVAMDAYARVVLAEVK